MVGARLPDAMKLFEPYFLLCFQPFNLPAMYNVEGSIQDLKKFPSLGRLDRQHYLDLGTKVTLE